MNAKLKLIALLAMMLVAGCTTTGQPSLDCTGALRLTDAQIENLTDEQAKRLLLINEDQQAKGCALPN